MEPKWVNVKTNAFHVIVTGKKLSMRYSKSSITKKGSNRYGYGRVQDSKEVL
jgi:hypothetical protein